MRGLRIRRGLSVIGLSSDREALDPRLPAIEHVKDAHAGILAPLKPEHNRLLICRQRDTDCLGGCNLM